MTGIQVHDWGKSKRKRRCMRKNKQAGGLVTMHSSASCGQTGGWSIEAPAGVNKGHPAKTNWLPPLSIWVGKFYGNSSHAFASGCCFGATKTD